MHYTSSKRTSKKLRKTVEPWAKLTQVECSPLHEASFLSGLDICWKLSSAHSALGMYSLDGRKFSAERGRVGRRREEDMSSNETHLQRLYKWIYRHSSHCIHSFVFIKQWTCRGNSSLHPRAARRGDSQSKVNHCPAVQNFLSLIQLLSMAIPSFP